MPLDIGVLKKVDRPRLPQEVVKSVGATTYTWEAFEGDIQIDGLNQFIELDGTTKLAEGIFKIILTPKGSNPEDPDYGTDINTSIGGKIDSEKFSSIQTSIVDALTHYNVINQDNPNSDEVIQTIDEVRLVSSLDDPRQINIQVSVTTESGKAVKIEVPQIQ
jgi:hypothetical protein